jgi:Bacterial Ig-like domain (group 1)
MGMVVPRSLVALQPFWKRTLLAVALALAIVVGLGGSVKPAKASVADLLILSTSITKPDAHGNPLSVEEQEAAALGLTVEIATPAQWAAKTTADFAAYKAIVLGDPTCKVGSAASIGAAEANGSVWGPAVNGNIEVNGTDPTFHTEFGPFIGPRQVVHSGLNFAASSGTGKTGAYVSLSCYYHATAAHTPVPVLDAFENAPGQFTVTGVGCYNDAHIVATSSALTGLTDANLSNWSCSVHEAFDKWASDFVVLAIARNIGTSYTAPDGSVGTPYIIARGNISIGDITLDPPDQTVCTGGTATVTATVKSGGVAVPGVTVTFTVNSGPNAGTTGTGVTDASGQASFSYSGTAAGTDSLTATAVISGHTQTSKAVTVNWSLCEQPITATGTTFSAVEGQPFSATVATITDPNPASTSAEYTATIDWGDLTPTSAGTISGPTGGPFTVMGSHTYKEEGTYTVKVHITDIDSTNPADATSTANVADAALTASPACSANSQLAFNGPTATFTDAASPSGTLSDFSATINWGDGTPVTAGTVTGADGGPYTVSGSHTYATTGNFTITTTIKDVGGSTATTSCNTLGFAFAPGGGSFVIGDQNAAVGTSVTFWGAQWAKDNSVSGGSAPKSFKGFAENPTTPSCNVAWTTDPGNSTPPPDGPLPTFMAVIVTSLVGKDGSEISGNTVHIVVVKTNPGYAANPGHAGTGTVVAVIC